jgi:hypothetical protein
LARHVLHSQHRECIETDNEPNRERERETRSETLTKNSYVTKGAFPPSHFCNKLDDKLARKVALVSL